jgi:hypothetical protein
VVSERLNDDSTVSRDQENESSLLQSDRSITSEEHVAWSKHTLTVKNFNFLKIQLWAIKAPIPTKKKR